MEFGLKDELKKEFRHERREQKQWLKRTGAKLVAFVRGKKRGTGAAVGFRCDTIWPA